MTTTEPTTMERFENLLRRKAEGELRYDEVDRGKRLREAAASAFPALSSGRVRCFVVPMPAKPTAMWLGEHDAVARYDPATGQMEPVMRATFDKVHLSLSPDGTGVVDESCRYVWWPEGATPPAVHPDVALYLSTHFCRGVEPIDDALARLEQELRAEQEQRSVDDTKPGPGRE